MTELTEQRREKKQMKLIRELCQALRMRKLGGRRDRRFNFRKETTRISYWVEILSSEL